MSVSQNGRLVVYTDNAANLGPASDELAAQSDHPAYRHGDQRARGENVFLYNRATGVTTLISHAASNANLTADGTSENGAISADGNWIAFVSNSDNLMSAADRASGASTGTDFQVYLYNVQTGVTTLVSHLASGPGQRIRYHDERRQQRLSEAQPPRTR